MQQTCPTREHLRQFLEGSVDAEKGTEITSHVEECSSCDAVLSSLESEQSDVLQVLREGARTESLLLEPEFEQLRDTFKIVQNDTTPGLEENEHLEPGKRLRDYRLVRKIGEGGMGTVYQAVHVHLAKPVAIKILPADKLQSKQSVSRFRQEMRAVGRVNHANVVSASDAGKIDGQHFLVMELVEGADLARIIQSRGNLSVADACEIVRQAAIGLQHAHDSGLIHRDVKPSNVMLAKDGNVKLLDLGLAGLNKTELGATSNVVVSDRLTSFGQIMGTLDYMAPEQVTASPDVDVRADVYALGATLFQLLTGMTPCGNRSQETPRRIEAILNEPPMDIAKLREDIPIELQALLLKMLAKSPAERPQKASDIASEIAPYASGSNLVALAEACQTSLDIPSADVEVTDDASFLFSHTIAPEKEVTRRKPLTAIGLTGFFLALIASVVFLVTHNGIVKVEVFDEDVKVSVDGKFLKVDEKGNSKLTKLWANDDHKLVVSLGGKELITENFEVRRGDELIFKVEYLQGKVLLQNNGKQIGSVSLTTEQISQAGLKQPAGPGTSVDDWQSRLTKLVSENPVVMVARLEKGQFTGKLNVHRIKSSQMLKGKQYRVKAAFSHLAFSDDYLPLNNSRPSPSMPELEAGEYVLILEATRIVHSSAASSFGFTITPNPSFNFTIVRDGRNHAAWKKGSRESQFILEMLGKEHSAAVSKSEKSETHSQGKTAEEETLADLPASDLAVIYRQLTGVELGVQIAPNKPSADLANSVNVLLQYESVSREGIAKSLVDLGRPELAKIVLSEGRTNPAATEALKLGDLLAASGDGDKAVDAYLEAFRLSPRLFNGDEHIGRFEKQNRLKELAELFTEERISKTNQATPQTELLKRLMQDDTRATIGLAFMERQWNARPDIRGFVTSHIPWNEVPDRLDYFRPLLIPSDFEAADNGWYELFSAPDVHGGWLVWLSDEIDEEISRQLLAEIKPKLEQHKNWIAGEALRGVLEAKVGNYEPAKQWLEANYGTVQTPTQGADRDTFLATYAEFLGSQLEGKDQELDLCVIKLYEVALEHRHMGLPYRDSKIHALAKLYHKYDRTDEARELLVGLVERESKVDEYLIENFGRAAGVNLDHERIWDLREAVETLNGIGQPMDSLALLSRISLEQRRKAAVFKGGGWHYDDQYVEDATRDSQKLLTAKAVVEAINRGVIPVGLASTFNKESGKIDNPIVELLKQVATDELSDEVRADIDQVNPKLATADSMDHHLSELFRRQPANTDIAVAGTLFAFLRNDIDAAQNRLAHIVAATNHSPFCAADVNLYLVARYALEHEETAESGRQIAERAMQAGKQMSGEWKKFFANLARTTEFSSYDGEGLAPFQLEELVRDLLKLERTRARGNHVLKQLWTEHHDRHYNLLTSKAQEVWPYVDDLQFFLRSKLVPANIAAEGAGWGRFKLEGVYELSEEPGWGYPLSLRPLLNDRNALEQLAGEVEAAVAQHTDWKAGTAVLSYLEAGMGNYQRAAQLLRKVLEDAETRPIPSDSAFLFGMALEGKDNALDLEVMRLYEMSLQNRPSRVFRASAIPKLGRLYAKYDQPLKARQTLHRLTNPDYDPRSQVICSPGRRPDNQDRCAECHHGKSNLIDIVVMSNNLTNIGYPVDAYVELARIDASFNNAYGSSDEWAKKNIPADFYREIARGKTKFLPAKNNAKKCLTSKNVLEALRSGVFSHRDRTRPSTTDRPPIDLMLGMRGNDSKNEVFSPVIEVFDTIVEPANEESHDQLDAIDHQLGVLCEANPNDIQTAAAFTVFALLREDLRVAHERLRRLENLFSDAQGRTPQDHASLWIVASYAQMHEETTESGRKLADLARQDYQEQSDGWKRAFQSQKAN